jgi:hypothetical protein
VSVFCKKNKKCLIVTAAVARTLLPPLSAIAITIAIICHATTIVVIGIAAAAIIVQVHKLPPMRLPI